MFSKVIYRDADNNPWLTFKLINRSTANDRQENKGTFTATIINNKLSGHNDKDYYLYQCGLTLETESDDLIVPYHERVSRTDTDEEKSMALLYRSKPVIAIGMVVLLCGILKNLMSQRSARQ